MVDKIPTLKESETYLKLQDIVDDAEEIEVLTMAVGYLHDLLYEYYDEYLTFNDINLGDVDLRCTTEPDGVAIDFEELDFTIEATSLNESILDNVPLSGLSDEILESIGVVINDIYDLMVEHGINPEESKEYQ